MNYMMVTYEVCTTHYSQVSYITKYTDLYISDMENISKVPSKVIQFSKVTSFPFFLMTYTPVFN